MFVLIAWFLNKDNWKLIGIILGVLVVIGLGLWVRNHYISEGVAKSEKAQEVVVKKFNTKAHKKVSIVGKDEDEKIKTLREKPDNGLLAGPYVTDVLDSL